MTADIQGLINSLNNAESRNQLPDKVALRSLHSTAVPNSGLLSPYTNQYQRTLTKRLVWLKYLDTYPTENPTEKTLFDGDSFGKITDAVKAFQKEAGIKEDGWAGPVTWKVLEQLVSFENDQDCLKWEKAHSLCQLREEDGKKLLNPALARAICLRLQAMGFLNDWSDLLEDDRSVKRKPICSIEGIYKALKKYNQFTSKIGFPTDPWPRLEDNASLWKSDIFITQGLKYSKADRVQAKSISWRLFRQDSLTQRLGQNKSKVNSIYENKDFKVIVRRIARIELWLNGFDVDFSSNKEDVIQKAKFGVKKVNGIRRSVQISPEKTKTDIALDDFWDSTKSNRMRRTELTGPRRSGRKEISSGINSELFSRFSQISKANDDFELDNDWDKLVCENNGESLGFREKLKLEVETIGSRIWDGVKRAASWLRRKVSQVLHWFKEGLKKVSQVIKNAARYIAQKARAAYRYVSAAFSIVEASWSLVESNINGGVAGYSTAGVAYFVSDTDFDQTLLIDTNATSAQLDQAIDKLKLWTRIYAAGARILGALGNVLIKIIKAVATPVVGWLSGLYTLAKLYKVVKSMVDEVSKIEDLLANSSQFQDMYEWIFGKDDVKKNQVA